MSARRAVFFLLLATIGLALPASAGAATEPRVGPCVPGQRTPVCGLEFGKASRGASDGDTIPVKIDGRAGFTRVRVTGVQAMELTDYTAKTGECRARDATLVVNRLLKRGKGRVRLADQDPYSASRKRPLRSVSVRIGSRWVDVGRELFRRGLAIRLNHTAEDHYNAYYNMLEERARRAQVGLFDPNGCGDGYQSGLPIQLWVNADPPGEDRWNLDEEFVTVRNNDPAQTLDLSNWWIRDGGLRRYTIPAGTQVAPGATLTVHVGAGTPAPGQLWWGLNHPVFDNPTPLDRGADGDGAYLFDPEGDIRAAMIYPCRYQCTDPLEGQLEVSAKPTGEDEFVNIINRAPGPVTLNGYRMRYNSQLYYFKADDVLQPGGALRVNVQGYPEDDVPGTKSWGFVEPLLNNRNGTVTVETYNDIRVGCTSWGTGSCEAPKTTP